MKYSIVFSAALACFMLTVLTNCNKGSDPSPQEKKFKQLKGVWELGTVMNDNVDVTSQYSGFTLTISSDGSFTSTNGHNAWPASGTLEFTDNGLNAWLRSDDITITLEEATSTTLKLSFTQSGISGGRVSGVTGEFEFSLIR
jgi:hypothetical protein